MAKYTLLVLVLISGVLSWIYFGVGRHPVYSEMLAARTPHAYTDPAKNTKNIHITAVYFVPRDKIPVDDTVWKESFASALENLSRFHTIQFQGMSQLHYHIYPNVIVGEKESSFYDTDTTDKGNPRGLENTMTEIERRLTTPGGDLYDPNMAPSADTYAVTYILYEGVGAAGAEKAAFLSRKFLTETQYTSVRNSLFSHEFYHTINIPDGYDPVTSIDEMNDIMGLGRIRVLEDNFIAPETLTKMGI